MKNIAIIAPQGAGKTTQAKLIAQYYKMYHLQMSYVLWKYVRDFEDNDLADGLRRNIVISAEKTGKSLAHAFQEIDYSQGIIFDGFPRRMNHLSVVDDLVQDFGIHLSHIFYIQLDEAICIDRLVHRRICPMCDTCYSLLEKNIVHCEKCGFQLIRRKDDTEEGIQERLRYFYELTRPILEHYKDNIIKINGDQSLENVFQEIQFYLGSA